MRLRRTMDNENADGFSVIPSEVEESFRGSVRRKDPSTTLRVTASIFQAMNEKPTLEELKRLCWQVRRDILIMLEKAGSGHPGGSLSAVEILVTLYYAKLRHDPVNPGWPERDRFILSKGHCCPVLYTVLAYRGFFPREELLTFRRLNSRLQGHVYRRVPGVEASTGSLGHGLSIANGMALAARLYGRQNRIYCLMGDGEMDEGQIWEAAMAASFRKLSNVCGILDRNQVQQDAETRVIKDLEPLADKWRACGWNVIEVDGHDCGQVLEAYDAAERVSRQPSLILAHTVKGKGVSFMEGKPEWHGKAPNKQELEKALQELDEAFGIQNSESRIQNPESSN